MSADSFTFEIRSVNPDTREPVINPETGVQASARFALPNDEWGLLCAFEQEARTLREAELVKNPHRGSFKLTCNAEGIHCELEGFPPDDLVKALLHRMRPFILNDEPHTFERVAKIMKRRLPAQLLQSAVQLQREAYSGRNSQAQVTSFVRLGGSPRIIINSDATLMLWLNSFEYHRDASKRADFGRLAANLPMAYLKFIFFDLLWDKVEAVHELARFIYYIGKRDGSPFIMRYISDETGKPLGRSPRIPEDAEWLAEQSAPMRPGLGATIAPATRPREYHPRFGMTVHSL